MPSTLPRLTEAQIQAQIVAYLSSICRVHRFGFFAVPNEALLMAGRDRTPQQFARLAQLKKMGLTPGVGDLVVFRLGRIYFFEVKKPGRKQTRRQKDFEAWAVACGCYYRVVTSLEQMQKYIENDVLVA